MELEVKDALLPELVKAIEENGEMITLCRNGVPVIELTRAVAPLVRKVGYDPEFAVKFAPGFDPTEPATEEEWPEKFR